MMSSSTYTAFIALLVVLALIFGVAWLARKFGLGGRIATRSGRRRLAIVEVLPLDGKRRLVLLRRDDVEHLVLIGAHDDVVVETAIKPASAEPPATAFATALGATS